MDAKKLTGITEIEYIENVWITITHGITQGQQLFTGLKITTDDGIFYVNSPYKVKIFGDNITISTSCMCVTFKVSDTPYTLDEIKDITYKKFYTTQINEPIIYGSGVGIGTFKSVYFGGNMSFDGVHFLIKKPIGINWNYSNKIIRFSVFFDDGSTVRNMTASWVYYYADGEEFSFSVYDYLSIENANPQFVQILMEFIEEP